ncbi:MAG: DNA-protecting protein DprA [Candidatus Tectomicrobia bacterium]|uniref:DNA-protecting protein DprA n=1 Tax=Tectimicrobiota bacterium TaxID=2528274 RepID=A0A938B442_UNCTE|nr:DNA-protecting protein DprA [Candidatus Tectomicrobia bacterium]
MAISSGVTVPEALTTQCTWLAFNMACATWPALRTQWAQYVTTPGVIQRLQTEGMALVTASIPGLAEKLGAVQQGKAFARELARLQNTEVSVVTLADAAYPLALRWIPEPPPVLYVWGTLQPEDHLALAVVGSRKPSPYGQVAAQRLSAALAQSGFTVVSGLARGIDSLAHQATLQHGGRTIAVLGSGINVIYPPEHRRLSEAIRSQGAVVSEFAFDTKPDRWNFPRRNRIISGLTLGTLVVEASEQSGSLHTARHALEQGREVFAVPGRIDVPSSRGTNNLIKRGAKLVEDIDDILEELPEVVRLAVRPSGTGQEAPACTAMPSDLAADEAHVLGLVAPEETHIEVIIQASALSAQVVASILVTLELRGLVRQFPGKFFTRC